MTTSSLIQVKEFTTIRLPKITQLRKKRSRNDSRRFSKTRRFEKWSGNLNTCDLNMLLGFNNLACLLSF